MVQVGHWPLFHEDTDPEYDHNLDNLIEKMQDLKGIWDGNRMKRLTALWNGEYV